MKIFISDRHTKSHGTPVWRNNVPQWSLCGFAVTTPQPCSDYWAAPRSKLVSAIMPISPARSHRLPWWVSIRVIYHVHPDQLSASEVKGQRLSRIASVEDLLQQV